MKLCPECGGTRVIMFDSDNDYCEKCKTWFPAVADIKCVEGCKTYGKKETRHHRDCFFYSGSLSESSDKLITKLADDVWAVAKKLEVADHREVADHSLKTIDELKTISSCLHDIRADHSTRWYKSFKVKNG